MAGSEQPGKVRRKWLPDATTPVGTILYSLIAAAIVALVSFGAKHVTILIHFH
jgi:hypothetical protein